MKKLIDTFIKEAKIVHNYKYDYSKSVYKNAITKMIIICPTHGTFLQSPNNHLNGHGCPKCSGQFSPTTEIFIERARKIHGDFYNYSKSVYKRAHEKIIVICPIHGNFYPTASSHVNNKSGCPKCQYKKIAVSKTRKNEEFIKMAKKAHGEKYDYTKTQYKKAHNRIIIICKKHGEFAQEANSHIKGAGCPKCRDEQLSKKYASTTKEFIKKAIDKHGTKYDYSLVNYKNATTSVKIICSEHGMFKQLPMSHLKGSGCKKCGNLKAANVRSLTTTDFIKKAKKIHGNRYLYYKTKHTRTHKKVIITCRKHGDFSQTATSHIRGSGCPKCSISKGEEKIVIWLTKRGINFIQEKTFTDLKSPKNGKLYYDFYLPKFHILIEYDGPQHFHTGKWYQVFNEEKFQKIKQYDLIKNQYSIDKKIPLFRIPYTNLKDINKTLKNIVKNNSTKFLVK
jgi:predicted nucleic-acid-binding Zn-ribbon protein